MVRTIRPQGVSNIDESRHRLERMDPNDYLASSYFERWLASLELNLTEKGSLSEAEIAAAVDEREHRGLSPSYVPRPHFERACERHSQLRSRPFFPAET
jgi:hypothetical protein